MSRFIFELLLLFFFFKLMVLCCSVLLRMFKVVRDGPFSVCRQICFSQFK